jgi:hypothetical protein
MISICVRVGSSIDGLLLGVDQESPVTRGVLL